MLKEILARMVGAGERCKRSQSTYPHIQPEAIRLVLPMMT